MSYTIQKRFTFEACHHLEGLRDGHPCGRRHGHGYRVDLVLEADELDATGFVVDYGDLSPFRRMIDEKCDHRDLNDLIAQPTAENLARYFFDWALPLWPQLTEVRVSETAKTWASYSRRRRSDPVMKG